MANYLPNLSSLIINGTLGNTTEDISPNEAPNKVFQI